MIGRCQMRQDLRSRQNALAPCNEDGIYPRAFVPSSGSKPPGNSPPYKTRHPPASAIMTDLNASSERKVILEITSRMCAEQLGKQLCAIVLTGSLARDEATFVNEGGARWRLLGDAEFLLIFQQRVPLPPTAAIKSLRCQIEDALMESGVACPIGLSAAHPDYLT